MARASFCKPIRVQRSWCKSNCYSSLKWKSFYTVPRKDALIQLKSLCRVSCQMYRNRKTIMTPWKNPIKTLFELKEKHWPHRNCNTSNLNKAIGNDLSSTKQREALVLPPMNSTIPPAWSSWCPNQYITVPVRRLTRKYGMSADMHVKNISYIYTVDKEILELNFKLTQMYAVSTCRTQYLLYCP